MLAASTLITMDGFSSLANAMSHSTQADHNSSEFASFGPVHLNITNMQRTTHFWTQVVGMKQRFASDTLAEFGTESQTLVVVHQVAEKPFQKGYSGLYHVAIHAPNIGAFASMVNRLHLHNYPYAPIDHTMSKSIYLDDPDGINIEFTLETPERFKKIISSGGLWVEGTDGTIRPVSDRLDVTEVMKELPEGKGEQTLSDGTYIGHIHLYANNVQRSNEFYIQMGFIQFNSLPEFMYADVGAGGVYQHRVAMNSWHGIDRPLAPIENAGLRHFQINFHSKEKLREAISNVSDFEEKEGGYWLTDPTGNQLFLTHKA